MIKGCKICGISDPNTLNFLVNHPHPPKFIGFIVNYKKSKRYVNFQKLKEKDYIAICDVGAYGMSLSSNYNLRTKPLELLIKNNKIKIIRKRQKHKDLI